MPIYKGTIGHPIGCDFLIAVKTTEETAKADIATIAHSEFNIPYGMLKVKGVKKSNKTLTKNMSPAKGSQIGPKEDQQYWAWIKRISL